jgi:putative membrane protein
VTELHAAHDGSPLTLLAPLLAAVMIVGYLAAVSIGRRPWPTHRWSWWVIGTLFALVSVSGPLAVGAAADFRLHMVTHVLLGMLAPLLLVLAAPVTLLLRTLPTPIARRLSRLLASRPVRILTEPLVAAVINIGGLWLLYRTALFPALHESPALHLLVHVHVFLAGYLFTVSMISIDPLPHRRSHLHRSTVLVLALAAHDVLAKSLYAHPPAGVPTASAETGAMIMYYGGDAVDVALMMILCAGWYRVRARRPLRSAGEVRCSAPST